MTGRRSTWLFGLALALLVLALGLQLSRPAAGQPRPAAVQDPARFDGHVGGGGAGTYILVIDRQTGHCWSTLAAGGGGWNDLGSPVPPP